MSEPPLKVETVPVSTLASQSAGLRLPRWLLVVVLALATVGVYWPATECRFINYDDSIYVTGNFHVQKGLTLENIEWAFSSSVAGNWHPVTILSHMLDFQMYGLNPWGHHLTNVLLHSLNTALVFALFWQLTGSRWRSALVAALFGLHPLHVESVAWVAERKDVLCGFFGLLSLIFYVRYAQIKKAPNHQHTTSNYLFALLFFALGLLSKVMLVTWPFVMLLLDYWPLGRFTVDNSRVANYRFTQTFIARYWPLLREKIPFFVLTVVMSYVALEVQGRQGAFEMVDNLTLGVRVENALISYGCYLEKMIWPTGLAVFYPHPGHWPLIYVLLAGLFLVVVTGLFFMKRREYPFLLMGWLWYLGTLVPVIGLVQVGGQAMADRYAYLPSLGIFVLVIWGAYALFQRWSDPIIAFTAVGGLVLVVCIALTWHQLGYWRDSETLFRHALAVTKNNYLAHINLGTALGAEGQMEEAIGQLQEAIRLKPDKPDQPQVYVYLAMALNKAGRLHEAVDAYQEALRLNPHLPEALNNLAWILATSSDNQLRNGAEAVRFAQLACELTSYNQPLFVGTLAAAYAEAGRFPDAVATAEKAEQLAANASLTAVVAKNRELLELYRANKPYHEPVSTRQKNNVIPKLAK
jgi:Tfp pilus assembly protein PilF